MSIQNEMILSLCIFESIQIFEFNFRMMITQKYVYGFNFKLNIINYNWTLKNLKCDVFELKSFFCIVRRTNSRDTVIM